MIDHADSVGRVFSALSDPIRRRIMEILQGKGQTVSQIAEVFGFTLAGALKHLRVLESAGLVQSRKEGRIRSYRLRELSMREAIHWMEHYQKMWTESLGSLNRYLNEESKE